MGSNPTPATMKILVLDDMEERQKWFADKLPKYVDNPEIFVAKDVDEAIKCFQEINEFDIMFLDHDLGGRIYVDSNDPNTGYQVAKYMVENGIKGKEIIIHTLNYAGAQNMMALLPDAKYVPFTSLYSRMV